MKIVFVKFSTGQITQPIEVTGPITSKECWYKLFKKLPPWRQRISKKITLSVAADKTYSYKVTDKGKTEQFIVLYCFGTGVCVPDHRQLQDAATNPVLQSLYRVTKQMLWAAVGTVGVVGAAGIGAIYKAVQKNSINKPIELVTDKEPANVKEEEEETREMKEHYSILKSEYKKFIIRWILQDLKLTKYINLHKLFETATSFNSIPIPKTAKLANSFLESFLIQLLNDATIDTTKQKITDLINSLRQLKLPPNLTLSDYTELAKFCSSSEVSGSDEKNKELVNKINEYMVKGYRICKERPPVSEVELKIAAVIKKISEYTHSNKDELINSLTKFAKLMNPAKEIHNPKVSDLYENLKNYSNLMTEHYEDNSKEVNVQEIADNLELLSLLTPDLLVSGLQSDSIFLTAEEEDALGYNNLRTSDNSERIKNLKQKVGEFSQKTYIDLVGLLVEMNIEPPQTAKLANHYLYKCIDILVGQVDEKTKKQLNNLKSALRAQNLPNCLLLTEYTQLAEFCSLINGKAGQTRPKLTKENMELGRKMKIYTDKKIKICNGKIPTLHNYLQQPPD